jgi:hypothetical protein
LSRTLHHTDLKRGATTAANALLLNGVGAFRETEFFRFAGIKGAVVYIVDEHPVQATVGVIRQHNIAFPVAILVGFDFFTIAIGATGCKQGADTKQRDHGMQGFHDVEKLKGEKLGEFGSMGFSLLYRSRQYCYRLL